MNPELQNDEMMRHLMDALEKGKDIGHYGRLVFVMAARPFLDNDEIAEWLMKDKDCDREKAQMLIGQVEARNYNPPRREKILEWAKRQAFPICPDSSDPDACNLYKSIEFPEEVYEHIGKYQKAKAG